MIFLRYPYRNSSKSRTYQAAAGGSVEISPDTASLVVTSAAPLVSISITPGVASLVITGQAPGAAIPVAYISWARIQLPAVAGAVVVPVGNASLTIDGQIPALSGGTLTAQPGAAGLALTAQTPVASRTTSSISRNPANANLAVTGQSVSISNGISVPVASNTRSMRWGSDALAAGYHVGYSQTSGTYSTVLDVGNVTTYVLTLTNGTWYIAIRAYDSEGTPGAWSSEQTFIASGLLVTGVVPTKFFNNIRDPAASSLILDAQTPIRTVRENLLFSPNEASLSIAGEAPSAELSAHQYITVGQGGDLVITSQDPTIAVSGNWWIEVGEASALIDGFAPNAIVAAASVVLPSNGALILNGEAPSLFHEAYSYPDAASLFISVRAPTIFVEEPHTVEVGETTLTLECFAPGVEENIDTGIVRPAFGELTVSGFAPSLEENTYAWVVSPAFAELTVQGFAPAVEENINTGIVYPAFAELVIAGQDVSFVQGGTFISEPDFAELVLSAEAPRALNSGDRRSGAGRSSRKKKRDKRWVLPNGMHVFGSEEEAQALAEQVTDKPVVVRQEKTRLKVIVGTHDGAQTEAAVIYPVERLGESGASPDIARTQVAPEPEIDYEAILNRLQEEKRMRRKKMAAALLL